MDRNYIVELIKANRLQEALKALEEASKGGYLHNDIINISAAFSEYTRLNRSATEDYQTLDIQRAKITNRILSVLDELSPEDLQAIAKPAVVHSMPKAAAATPSFFDNKTYLYGTIGIAALIIIVLVLLLTGSKGNDSATNPADHQTTMQTANENANGTSSVSEGIAQGVSIVNCMEDDKALKLRDEGSFWLMNGEKSLPLVEVKRENGIIYLRSGVTKSDIELELDLNTKQATIMEKGEGGTKAKLAITHFE